jgi:GNAT superfamily N-acetyltransferase
MSALGKSVWLPRHLRASNLPLVRRIGRHRLTLRWLRPDDAERLIAFFASHTPETIRHRYGYLFTAMPPDRAAALVGVDQTRDAALGWFEQREGRLALSAIGRYCLARDGHSAEVAFVVREDRRGLGLATALLHALIATARERGLSRLTAQVENDNGPMRKILQRAGATFAEIPGTSTDAATLALNPPPRRRPPASSGLSQTGLFAALS